MHEKTTFLFTLSCADVQSFRQWAHLDSEKERNAGIREVAKEHNVMYVIRSLKAGRRKGKECIEVLAGDRFNRWYSRAVRQRSGGLNTRL